MCNRIIIPTKESGTLLERFHVSTLLIAQKRELGDGCIFHKHGRSSVYEQNALGEASYPRVWRLLEY